MIKLGSGSCPAPVFLSRALNEIEPQAKIEFSANHTWTLNENKSETQFEFSVAGRVEHLKNRAAGEVRI